MWDKPQALNWLANLFFALALVMFMYGVLFVVIHLPIFPLREVKVDGQLTHVTREQVKLIVGRYIQGNFFTLDLPKTRTAFQKLPWAPKAGDAWISCPTTPAVRCCSRSTPCPA